MAASDTVVGIVGSVVLVAVMVGVFVYEYNNAPEPEETPDDGMTGPTNMGDSASGALGPGGQNTFNFEFSPDEGVTSIVLTIDWTAAAALPVGPAGQYTYTLMDADGNELTSSTTGDDASFTIDGEDASSQVYTLSMTLPQGSAGGNFDVEVAFAYDSMDAEA